MSNSASLAWNAIQARIWACDACKGDARVELNVRQQTPQPAGPASLLFIGIAPPEQGSPYIRTEAKSATNYLGDNLRRFIEEAADLTWDELVDKRACLVHAVKCAIVPDSEGFQNPPNHVIDRCHKVGFADEFNLLRPTRIVAFGGAARRAVLKHQSVKAPRGVLSKSFAKLQESWPDGIPCKIAGTEVTLHPTPFPRSPAAKKTATRIVQEAVRLARLKNAAR